jgi:hypothetical protein
MSTEKQIAANRQNATKSTGPISTEGKARAAQNARTHGLTAARMVVAGEEAAAVEAFRHACYLEWQPVGAFETTLVDEIVFDTVRLGRVPWIEASVLDIDDEPVMSIEATLCQLSGLLEPPEPVRRDPCPPPDLGRAFRHHDMDGLLTTRLPRYEAKLARRRDRAIDLLMKVQARRRAAEADAEVLPDDPSPEDPLAAAALPIMAAGESDIAPTVGDPSPGPNVAPEERS